MIMVSNTIKVKKGYGKEVANRFKDSKGIHQFDAFVRMEVLLTRHTEDHDLVKVCTFWESEEGYKEWRHSDVFKKSHEKRPDPKGNEQRESVILGNKPEIHDVIVTLAK